jgi:predicted secreted hydrolase
MKKIISLVVACGLLLSAAVYTACQKKEDFAFATKSTQLTFPKDLAAHNDYRTEWWYYTGHLKTTDGSPKTFGFELTFFRTALSFKETMQDATNKNIYFAHFAVTDESGNTFFFQEKQSRGSFGDGGAMTDFYRTWIGNWSVQTLGKYHLLQAEDGDEAALRLILEPTKPPTLHGQNGYSQKGDGETNASMYYSYTRMKTVGSLILNGKHYEVEGESWEDHEFGTSTLPKTAVGWDWFALMLDNNTEIMLYSLRQSDGTANSFSSGTVVYADGKTEHLAVSDFQITVKDTWTSAKSKATYPAKWHIAIPKLKFEADVTPTVNDQELLTKESTRISYWEGSTRIAATIDGKSLAGNGYTELTGYAEAFKQNF